MAAQLGQTSDPAALIPGNPESLYTTVGQLLDYAAVLEEAGKGLAAIDTTSGWEGAAGDAFRKIYHGQPAKWTQAGGAFTSAATALADYAQMLTWAQQTAADAIRTWDSGASNHRAATAMLDNARSTLAGAAKRATGTVQAAAKLAPPAPGFWSQAGSFFSGAWHDTGHAVETGFDDFVNGAASFGNAAIHDPGGLLATAGGLALAGISAGGEGVGFALDATGIGAVIGVPVNVVSAAGIATGLSIAGAGVTSIAIDAAGLDRVTVLQASSNRGSGGSGGSGAGGSGSQTVKDVLKTRKGSIRQAPLPPGSPSWNDIQDMTMQQIQEAADNNVPGFKTIAKLLKDGRFKK